MRRYAIAGLAAGAAMMIGGALAAVSGNAPSPTNPTAADAGVMNPMIAGQAMLASRTILDNISASPDHTALVAAMRDSGVAGVLKASAQFTVFAPTNAAMAAVPAQDKARLARQMGYLVVPGKYDSQALLKAIALGGGQAKLRTVEGGVLIARLNGPANIILVDANGGTANVTVYDVYDRNGVVHVVDHMLQPGIAAGQYAAN